MTNPRSQKRDLGHPGSEQWSVSSDQLCQSLAGSFSFSIVAGVAMLLGLIIWGGENLSTLDLDGVR